MKIKRNPLIVLGKPIGVLFVAIGLLLIILSWLNVYKTDATGLGLLLSFISCGLGWIALSVAYSSGSYEERMLEFIRGEISQQFSAEFDVARVINKVQLTVAGREFVVYNSNRNIGMKDVPFYFGNAVIFPGNMKEKDTVRIRMYIYKDRDKYLISKDEENTFKGKQTGAIKIDGGFYNQEGIEITAEHIVAESSPLEISCYAYDAARGS
ncbi:MAG: hypothetical protein PHQ86_07535 [Dehalococcoidales bacterium]|nr:hypothetical protein [Dehalococcoidales bacterium]